MKRFLFSTLMLLLLSCVTDSFAQSFHRGEVPRKPKRSAKVDVTNKRKPTGKPLKTQQQMFEEFSRPEGLATMTGAIERRYIQKGDSVRLKIYFPNRIIEHISVDGVSTTQQDVIKGVFIPTIKPDTSKVIYARVKHISNDPTKPGMEHFVSFIVLVFDSEEYQKVDAKVKKFEAAGDAAGRAAYLRSLEGDLHSKLKF